MCFKSFPNLSISKMVFLLLWGSNIFTAFVFFPFLLYLSWEYPPFLYSSSSFWNSFNLLVPCHKLPWGIAVCHGRKFSFPFLTMKFPEIDLHFLQIILLGYINSLSLVILAIPFAGSTVKKQWDLRNIQARNWEGRHSYLCYVSSWISNLLPKKWCLSASSSL